MVGMTCKLVTSARKVLFGMAAGGADAVIWGVRTSSFPYVSGVIVIIISWFASPLLAGVCSYLLFILLRVSVLRGTNTATRAIWCLPVLLLVTLFVNLFFILTKVSGLTKTCWKHTAFMQLCHSQITCRSMHVPSLHGYGAAAAVAAAPSTLTPSMSCAAHFKRLMPAWSVTTP